MDSEQLMLVLGNLELPTLQALVAEIGAISSIKIMKPARTALVMMGVKDSVQMTPFYLGEVLVSQCVVSVDGAIGYGFVMGEALEKVYCLAVMEAALVGNHPLTAAINQLVLSGAEARKRQNQLEYSLIVKTKVRFETMEETSDEPSA